VIINERELKEKRRKRAEISSFSFIALYEPIWVVDWCYRDNVTGGAGNPEAAIRRAVKNLKNQ